VSLVPPNQPPGIASFADQLDNLSKRLSLVSAKNDARWTRLGKDEAKYGKLFPPTTMPRDYQSLEDLYSMTMGCDSIACVPVFALTLLWMQAVPTLPVVAAMPTSERHDPSLPLVPSALSQRGSDAHDAKTASHAGKTKRGATNRSRGCVDKRCAGCRGDERTT
jgi:hypothetical protein